MNLNKEYIERLEKRVYNLELSVAALCSLMTNTLKNVNDSAQGIEQMGSEFYNKGVELGGFSDAVNNYNISFKGK